MRRSVVDQETSTLGGRRQRPATYSSIPLRDEDRKENSMSSVFEDWPSGIEKALTRLYLPEVGDPRVESREPLHRGEK